ncbi:phage holin family protein [Pantoea stewartii]|nr:phage holin family protein [Pantoea stewartii]
MDMLTDSQLIFYGYLIPVMFSSFLAMLRMYRSHKGLRPFITEAFSCAILQMALSILLIYYKVPKEVCIFSGVLIGLLGTKKIIKMAEIIILRRLR